MGLSTPSFPPVHGAHSTQKLWLMFLRAWPTRHASQSFGGFAEHAASRACPRHAELEPERRWDLPRAQGHAILTWPSARSDTVGA